MEDKKDELSILEVLLDIFTKIKDIKADPKIKNYNVIFHNCSAANEFTRNCKKNSVNDIFFIKIKRLFHKNKKINSKKFIYL